jgi:hypothetical protein
MAKKPLKKPPRRRSSYGWALKLLDKNDPVSHLFADELAALSAEAQEGLELLERLASGAAEYAIEVMYGEPVERMTIARLAWEEGPSETTIRRRIVQLQVELFGRQLSRSGIYYRFERRMRLGDQRRCAEPGCSRTLRSDSHANRRHCDEHRAPAARIARHRRRASLPASPA